MNWLVTFKKQIGRDQIVQQLQSLPCEVHLSERHMPLETDEEVLAVEGPANLAQLVEPFQAIMKIYPNSKMSAF
jgi:hypothetical protein